jgi:hypothetical protein
MCTFPKEYIQNHDQSQFHLVFAFFLLHPLTLMMGMTLTPLMNLDLHYLAVLSLSLQQMQEELNGVVKFEQVWSGAPLVLVVAGYLVPLKYIKRSIISQISSTQIINDKERKQLNLCTQTGKSDIESRIKYAKKSKCWSINDRFPVEMLPVSRGLTV